MAVRVGFEPTVPFPVRIFSKDVLSTTQPPHQKNVVPLWKRDIRGLKAGWSGPAVAPETKARYSRGKADVYQNRGTRPSQLFHTANCWGFPFTRKPVSILFRLSRHGHEADGHDSFFQDLSVRFLQQIELLE